MTMKNYNDIKASEALRMAQFIATAPFIFQAVVAMKKLGILKTLAELNNGEYLTKEQLVQKCGLPYYSVSVLVDLALSSDILIMNSNQQLCLSKIGYYLATDTMTNVNMDFSHYTCYNSLFHLTESLQTGKPEGLKVFTDSVDTLYPYLKTLPSAAKKSWFNFDHYYSNLVFDQILELLFKERKYRHICDIGGNTGKFALAATSFDPDVSVTIADLPEQCEQAMQNIGNKAGRINFHPINILDSSQKLPENNSVDLWWMSQFLDCFSIEQIEQILKKIHATMTPESTVVITEIFGDKQKNDIASLVIDATSLYFTALANGYSRFYHSDDLIEVCVKSGFKVDKEIDALGLGHSVLILSRQ